MPTPVQRDGSEPVDYGYDDASPRWADGDVVDALVRVLGASAQLGTRIMELGCGNGLTAARLARLGYRVDAVDPSQSGIAVARAAHPEVAFEVASTDDDLAGRFGRFPVVVSLEVVEHCMSPALFARRAFELLEPGGLLVLSTPYHGYVKNLLLAVSGRMDAHFGALWEGGHVKFFSIKTIAELLRSAGFERIEISRVGRVPVIAKSMVVTARRPA